MTSQANVEAHHTRNKNCTDLCKQRKKKDYFSFSSLLMYAFVFIFLVDSFCNCVCYSYSFSKKNTVIKKLLIKNRDLAHCSLSRFCFYFLHVVLFFLNSML